MKKNILFICVCLLGIAAASAQQKVFKGKWEYKKGALTVDMNINLYTRTIENGMDMDGAMCYGEITFKDEYTYYSVDEVTVKGNTATLKVFNGETEYFKVKLTYLPQTKEIEWVSDGKNNKLPVKVLFKKSALK